MKSLFVVLVSLFAAITLHAQTWIWSPDAPQAGENLKVDLKFFATDNNIHVVAYTFMGAELQAADIYTVVDQDGIHMNMLVPSWTNWVRLVIKDKNGDPLIGDDKVVVKAGSLPKAGMIEKAMALNSYYRMVDLKKDNAEILSLYKEAIQASPKWLDKSYVLSGYFAVANATGSTDDLKIIRTHLQSINSDQNAVSSELLTSAVRISKDLGDTLLQQSLRKKLDATDPKSMIAQEEMQMKFNRAASLEEKIAIRDQFKSTYGITDKNKVIYDKMTSGLIDQYAGKEDWTMVSSMINEITDPMRKASVCNNYAWTLAGEGIEGEAPHLDVASQLSATSLSAISGDLNKPSMNTKLEWERNLDFTRAMYGDTYAVILYKEGKYNEALDHQSFAVKTYQYEDIEMNDRYALYLEKAGHQDELLDFIDDMIVQGTASAKMKETHKRIWTTERTPDQLYNQYVSTLEAKAKEKKLEEIQAMWMDAPAIDFKLKNLKGEEVSLSDYKGKTVVLDFWATWCGPCKASFPGMKTALEHYASDDDVVFLFIDTWETGENIPDKVSSFLKENNYPFHALLDGKNQVVANYKVEGIPTKFIIDKDQKIRFKVIGYNGSEEGLVEELMTMIEMTQNGGKTQKS